MGADRRCGDAACPSRQMIAARKAGRPVAEQDYSEQYLLSCGTGVGGDFSCSGGYPDQVLVYLRDVGAPRERCYLSRGQDEPCPADCPDSDNVLQLFTPVASMSNYAYPGDTVLKQQVYDNGPVTVAMDMYSDFYTYDAGIYRHTTGGVPDGSTMVTVVGWGLDAGTEYWIAKNSWGTWWGEDGYIRIDRASRGGCNFASYVYTCAVDLPPVTAVGEPSPPGGLLVRSQPNPFNPRTTICFEVPAAGNVRLEVYDLRGRLVRVLVDADLPAGSHQRVWDGNDARGLGAASGCYFARVSAGGMIETVRMGLVR